MDDFWLPLVTVAAFGLILGSFVWLASLVRRRGVGGSVLGPIEEQWDPAAYRSHLEIQVQVDRRAPTPAPGDPPWPGDQ